MSKEQPMPEQNVSSPEERLEALLRSVAEVTSGLKAANHHEEREDERLVLYKQQVELHADEVAHAKVYRERHLAIEEQNARSFASIAKSLQALAKAGNEIPGQRASSRDDCAFYCVGAITEVGEARRTLLKLRADGSSDYSDDDALKEAAVFFWRDRPPGAVVTITFGLDQNNDPAFRINQDGSLDCLNGYFPTGSTRHALETIAKLRPA